MESGFRIRFEFKDQDACPAQGWAGATLGWRFGSG
jgi:hypothetical protein